MFVSIIAALSFKSYFDFVLSKATQRAAGLRTLGVHCTGLRPKTGLKLYKALVRPIFEYGAQVIKPTISFIMDHNHVKLQTQKLF